jgi:hypothetical protein
METLGKVIEIIGFGLSGIGLGRETFMVASTFLDLAAVGGLAWLVVRGGRERDAALAEQRAALEALRTDLGELLADAERRGQALEESLAGRERSLRDLLAKVGRVEEKRAAAKRAPAQPAPSSAAPRPAAPSPRPAGLEALRGDLAQVARKLNVDPAEARLLRDLEVSLGSKQG